jgi:serine protease AprX
MSDHARKIIGVEAVNDGGEKWTGEGELVGVIDSGIDTTHPDLKDAVEHLEAVPGAMDKDRVGHGTHVSGTIAGRGTASKGTIRGMAPGARLVGLGAVAETGRLVLPADLGELLAKVADRGAKIINLSWGTPVASAYENGSMAIDTFAREHPDVLVVVASGNLGVAPEGYPTLYKVQAPATAKNVLTVGASSSDRRIKQDWQAYAGDRFPAAPTAGLSVTGDTKLPAAFSSRGPTDTDSVKPELLAPGTAILAARAGLAPASEYWSTFDEYGGRYGYMNGTSMATPVASGAAAVLRQYLREERKIKSPGSALMRAALIAGSLRLPWSRSPGEEASCGFPDFDQGFGRIDLSELIPHKKTKKGHRVALLEVDNKADDALAARAPQGDPRRAAHSYLLKVPKGTKEPLRIVLAWTDYSARAVQNLLKLDVRQSPDGGRWRGNEEHHWLQPPEAALDPETLEMRCDQRNNVQIVVIPAPPPGEYHVRVVAQNTVFPPQGFAVCAVGGFEEGGLSRES